MATKAQRTFGIVGAVLFLVTSSSLTIAVIFANIQSSKASSNNKQGSNISKMNSKQPTTQPTNKLAGTKLNGFTPVQNVTSLQTEELSPGDGQVAKDTDNVNVDYTGAVAATGIIFQSSLDTGQPVSFPLNGVIQGFKQGIAGMKVGSTRRIIIPSNLAYGTNPPAGSGIPSDAPLVFDVTLHSIGAKK